MSYDIGIGTCIGFDGRTVTVRLDRAMVPRLIPSLTWPREAASLRILREQCSSRRPLEVGEEVWLDSARIDTAGMATLDLGNGERVEVDLGALIRDTEPVIDAPAAQPTPAQATPRVWQTPHTDYVRGARSALSRFR